jgi:hypothetical protein
MARREPRPTLRVAARLPPSHQAPKLICAGTRAVPAKKSMGRFLQQFREVIFPKVRDGVGAVAAGLIA